MALRSEVWRPSEAPSGPLQPNWEHPFFAGATEALVVVGGQPMRYLRDSKLVQPTAYAGSMAVAGTALGQAWSSQNSSSMVSFGPAFSSRYSALQICSSGWVRTCTFDNHYYGIISAIPSAVAFGNGGFAGPDGRRTYTVAGSGTGRVIAVRPAAAITTAPTVYVDGQARTATYSSGNAVAYDWNPYNAVWEIGFDVGNNIYTTGDRCELFVAVLGDPSDAAMALATADPWSLFLGLAVDVPASAGGSSVSLIVADATHGHTVDGLVLTSSTALAVAEATHAHAADAITLAVGSVLTVAEASHAHAADSPALTAASALAVADATHSHAADNITLSVAGATNLTVADALHGHAADALALTSAHALIVADATHGHAVDGLTLTAASVLAIQEALHAHAADNITLDASGAVNLLLADGLHAHTADGVALTVAAWLTVADALHGHAADNVVLTFGGAVVEPLARYTIAAKARRLTITAAARRLEIRK